MKNRLLAIAVCAVSLTTIAAAPAAERPNIVFLLADDLGWRDVAIYGSRFYETPNIDRLVRRGMMFTDAYAASPLCSPTRASILTGQYPGRLRLTSPAGHIAREVLNPRLAERASPTQKAVTPGSRTRLPNSCFTLAEALRGIGYATAFVGKWHLGRDPYLPENQGFDRVVGGNYYEGPPEGYFAPWPLDTIPESPPGSHISDVSTTEAIKFIRANRQRPFLICLWFYDVHSPFESKQDLVKKYRKRLDPNDTQRCPTMGAMIEVLDTSIGRVLDTLDELNIAENTLIVFTSDNGGNVHNEVDGTTPTNNHPLRSGKGSIYEGGVRVPTAVVWPGHVESGSKTDAVVTSIDYYPTILDVLGLKPQADQVLDGVSILPVLSGEKSIGREAVFCHLPHYVNTTGNRPSTSVRRGGWKLIRFYADNDDQTDRLEVYNLADDIGETRNLAAEKPELTAELLALIERHIAETKPLVPVPNPAYQQAILGWQPMKDANISQAQGRLLINSTGPDPILQTSDIPSVAGSVEFEVRMRSTVGGKAQVFWGTRRYGYHQGRSAVFDLMPGQKWHEYRVTLNPQTVPNSIRFDPCRGPGELEVEWIRLRNANGEIIKQWKF